MRGLYMRPGPSISVTLHRANIFTTNFLEKVESSDFNFLNELKNGILTVIFEYQGGMKISLDI